MGKRSRYGFVDRNDPEAAGMCDRGGEVRKRSELKPEMEWVGNRLLGNGFFCCDQHRDRPNPQDRTLVLRADPVAIDDPRPLLAMTPLPTVLSDGRPTPGTVQTASVITADRWGRPLLTIPGRRFSDAFDYPPGTKMS